jgi:DNA-binding transcriptional MerR regulator
MGILIKAPTRRSNPGLQIAAPAATASGDARSALHIREVVRITGLRREQLYMWQRRYGFPHPARDGFGDRVYPPDQVARLKVIKQLLSEGWRAGAVVPLAEPALQSMLGIAVDAPAPLPAEIETAVTLLGEHRVGELQNHLSKLLVGQGLRRFLEQTLIPLNEAVHERVVRGEMQNFQELRFADLAQRLLRDVTRLVRPTRDAGSPVRIPDDFLPKDRCIAFFRECLANGLIMMGYTPRVRVHPPLIISAEEAARAVEIIDAALNVIES